MIELCCEYLSVFVYLRVFVYELSGCGFESSCSHLNMKLPFVIYADLECLLKKMSTCINNPNESPTTKINKHVPSGYSIFTHCSFDESKNKLNYYRKDDCMNKFCKDLRDHVTKIINYEKKKMIPLTTKENIYHSKQKIC